MAQCVICSKEIVEGASICESCSNEKQLKTPDWAKEIELGRGKVEIDGIIYHYAVLSKELEPDLPGFVGFSQGEYLFCSEDVPEPYRTHILGHEVRCGQSGRCLNSLKKELEGVPDDIKPEYIEYRKVFFERLVNYYKNQTATDDFRREIQASLDYLKTL